MLLSTFALFLLKSLITLRDLLRKLCKFEGCPSSIIELPSSLFAPEKWGCEPFYILFDFKSISSRSSLILNWLSESSFYSSKAGSQTTGVYLKLSILLDTSTFASISQSSRSLSFCELTWSIPAFSEINSATYRKVPSYPQSYNPTSSMVSIWIYAAGVEVVLWWAATNYSDFWEWVSSV